MAVTLDNSLHTTLSSLDLGTTLDEVEFPTYTPQKSSNMSSVHDDNNSNIRLSGTMSRGPPPPLPTTCKPKVAVTRSSMEDFVLMESSVRDSIQTWLNEQLTDNSSDENSSLTSHVPNQGRRRRVRFQIDTSHSHTNLVTFDRNSQTRIAKRRRFHQRSIPSIHHSSESQATQVTSLPLSHSKISGFPLKAYMQNMMKKIFS